MNECIYVTFDKQEFKYYIGKGQVSKIENGYIGSSQYKNNEGAYDGPNREKHIEMGTYDPLRWFTSVLATFNSEDGAYAAETDLQIKIGAAADINSYNMSNDSFRKGSQAKKSLLQRFIPSTWWGSGKTSSDASLSADDIKKIVRYIKDVDYSAPQKFNLIETKSEEISETGKDDMRVDLIQFQNQARKDCYDRGYSVGSYPSDDRKAQELNILEIELNGQLDGRLFNLAQELVTLKEDIKHLPKESNKFTGISGKIVRLAHEVDYIEDQVRGKWLEIITAAFDKGYIQRINDDE